MTRGICEQISGITVWRWLSEDAIKPWQYRSWIFPRDPEFTAKAARILDLYAGRWEGELLHPGDYVVCCDEKPSIQARHRRHTTLPAQPGVPRGQRVEHEYKRGGSLCYFAAWDVRRAKLFDRCDEKDGIVPFDKLVDQFMTVEPYSKARRVFVIVDNGSAHRGKKSIKRLEGRYKNLILVHTPIHASWLNQAEIYFSIVQRKVAHPQRLPGPLNARTSTPRVRSPLRADRRTVRVEVHPRRPRPPRPEARPARRPSRLTPNTSANFRARALSGRGRASAHR